MLLNYVGHGIIYGISFPDYILLVYFYKEFHDQIILENLSSIMLNWCIVLKWEQTKNREKTLSTPLSSYTFRVSYLKK